MRHGDRVAEESTEGYDQKGEHLTAAVWGAHAPRVLVLAPRQNALRSLERSSCRRGRQNQHARRVRSPKLNQCAAAARAGSGSATEAVLASEDLAALN